MAQTCEHETSPFVPMNYKILILLIYILYAGMEFYLEKVIQQVFVLCKFSGRGSRHLWQSIWFVVYQANS